MNNKALTMKKLLLCALALVAASPALAYDYEQSSNGLKVTQFGDVDVRYYVAMCHSFRDVGVSRFFGTPAEYKNPYPELGLFSAQIEKVNAISSLNRAFFNDTMTKAHEFQYNTYRSLAQNKMGFQRYSKMISEYPETYKMQKEKYDSYRTEVLKQRAYNVKKTINDITAQLDTQPSHNSNGHNYEKTDWDYVLECRRWWKYEQENEHELTYR